MRGRSGAGRANPSCRSIGRVAAVACLAAGSLAFAGCQELQTDVGQLASDASQGRQNNTPGSAIARGYIISRLKPITAGLNTSATGSAAYTQAIPEGTNVVAMIRGRVLPRSYVIIGAHYDHLGRAGEPECRQKSADQICNGASDNASGVSAVLALARAAAKAPMRPRRSIVFALWDGEEDGLVGSKQYLSHPSVPLADTVAYVNVDGIGVNLLPSLRNTTISIAAESGGPRLQGIVNAAIHREPLDTLQVSGLFGEGRSDYQSFLDAQIPSVFFTDSSGGCYHTTDDDPGIVDFRKLKLQTRVIGRVLKRLADTRRIPVFTPNTPVVSYRDAVEVRRAVVRGIADIGMLAPADQDTVRTLRSQLDRIVADGPAAFGSEDYGPLLSGAAKLVNDILPGLPCRGYLASGGGKALLSLSASQLRSSSRRR